MADDPNDTKQSAFCPQPPHGTNNAGEPCYRHCNKVAAHPNEPHYCPNCQEEFGMG